MSSRLISLVAGVAVAAGAVGIGLDLAGVDSAVRATLVLLFLAVAPTAAIAGLLRTPDGFARLIIACTANIALLALTAIIMLAGGVWSPTGGLLAVAAITAACLVVQLPPVRRGVAARAASWRKALEHLAARAGQRGTKTWLDETAAAHRESFLAVRDDEPAATAATADPPTWEFPAVRDDEPAATAATADPPTWEFPAVRDDEPAATAATADPPTREFPAVSSLARPAVATGDALTSEFPAVGDPEALAAKATAELPADDKDDAQPAAAGKDTSKAGRR
jgi:hypothetical protein